MYVHVHDWHAATSSCCERAPSEGAYKSSTRLAHNALAVPPDLGGASYLFALPLSCDDELCGPWSQLCAWGCRCVLRLGRAGLTVSLVMPPKHIKRTKGLTA